MLAIVSYSIIYPPSPILIIKAPNYSRDPLLPEAPKAPLSLHLLRLKI